MWEQRTCRGTGSERSLGGARGMGVCGPAAGTAEEAELCWEEGPDCSHPPEQQVVRAVVPPHSLAAVGQTEVLVAVPSADDQ